MLLSFICAIYLGFRGLNVSFDMEETMASFLLHGALPMGNLFCESMLFKQAVTFLKQTSNHYHHQQNHPQTHIAPLQNLTYILN